MRCLLLKSPEGLSGVHLTHSDSTHFSRKHSLDSHSIKNSHGGSSVYFSDNYLVVRGLAQKLEDRVPG